MMKDNQDDNKKDNVEKTDTIRESLLTFPCDFPVKIIGEVSEQFESDIIKIVRQHYPNLQDDAIQRQTSKQGTYLALSITVHAISQATLDALYQDLSKHPGTKMVL
jgi:uncharacterized protein